MAIELRDVSVSPAASGRATQSIAPEIAVRAVFAATKQELSLKRSREIEQAPPGRIQQLWQQA